MSSASATEPTAASFRSPTLRAIAATRPAFLSVTAAAVMVGIANAAAAGIPIEPARVLVTLLLALLAHAAGNLINDWADAGNGGDAINTARIFPFTGGSRFIDNGVLTREAVARFALCCALAAALGGIALSLLAGPWLLAVGAAGMLLAFAYSMPPLWLVARGLGEATIAAVWLLVVVGADGVMRGAVDLSAAIAGLPLALLVANILFVNQFPDQEADSAVGKRTLVVRLGLRGARGGSALLALMAYGSLVAGVHLGYLPTTALVGLVSTPLSAIGAVGLWRRAAVPSRLGSTIRLTIAAAVLHGVAVAIGLWFGR